MNIDKAIENGWQELKDPTLINFEKPGDSVDGILLNLTTEKVNTDLVLTARMELLNGELVKFRPSYNLREKIGRRHIGKRMLIVFDREDKSTEGKGNAMKVYRVLVAPDASAEAPFVPTDGDVPPFPA